MSKGSKGPNTSRWTIAKFLEEVYVPEKRRTVGLSIDTAAWYRQEIQQLDKFVGRPVKLREISDALLADFCQWRIDRGCKEKTAHAGRQTVKSILRFWRPDEHPKNLRTGPSRQFLEADVNGSLEQLFQEHYLPAKPKISSPHTITQYGRSLRKFTEFLGHTATLADLSDKTLGQFLRHRLDAGVCARTVNGEAKQIKAIWNWAAKKHLVTEFPTIGKLAEPEIIPRAWTREELEALIAACRRCKGTIAGVPAAGYWLAFHLMLWDSGERTGAMRALTWSMLDRKSGHLTVPAEIRKGRHKAMVYRLKPATLAVLDQIELPRRELIFPCDSPQAFHVKYRRLIIAAGLPYVARKSGPQKMRRTFASFVTAAGGDATAALRHSTRRVTEESYNDPAIANPTPANALLFDLDQSE
jgi:site-specific recombinase XerD